MAKSNPKHLNSKEIHTDVQLASSMICAVMLSKDGVESMKKLIGAAKNPVMVFAHMIYGAIAQVKNQLESRKISFDDKIWMAKGGVLDRVMVELMVFVATGLKYKLAGNGHFVDEVKRCVIALMEKENKNGEAIKLLMKHKLPVPEAPDGAPKLHTEGLPDKRHLHAIKKAHTLNGLAAPGGAPQYDDQQQQSEQDGVASDAS